MTITRGIQKLAHHTYSEGDVRFGDDEIVKFSYQVSIYAYEARTPQPLAVSGVRHASMSVSSYYVLYFGYYRCPRVRVVSGVRVGVGAS